MKQLALLLFFLSASSVIFGQDDSLKNAVEEEEDDEVEVSGESELQKRGDQTMTNIGYLFRGYNILQGNPVDPDKAFDPGFRAKIFKATYNGNRKTDDERYRIPDNVDITGKLSCSTSFSSETVMTMSEYQNSLLAKASVSGSAKIKVVDASFTASIEYNRMRKTIESNTKTVIKSEATCTVYEAIIQTGTPPELSENFIQVVQRASRTKNYGDLLDTFGTHFVESVDMGARLNKLQEISKKNQEKMQKDGIDVKRSASLSAAGIGSISTDNQFKTDRTNTEKFERAVENTKIVTVGSRYPSDGKDSTWHSTSLSDPLPIYYRLKSITEIFTPSYFKDSDIDLELIKREVTQYLKGYCNRLKTNRFPDAECEGPPKGCAGGSQCSVNAECIDRSNGQNEEKKYECKCKPGYKGNGNLCIRNPKWEMTSTITQKSNRGGWGTWGGMEYCKPGIFASGFLFRAEKSQGSGDDTGGNAVCLQCRDETVCSKEGQWGEWSDTQRCPRDSFISGWRQNVEGKLGWGNLKDDTALDNVEYKCRNIETWAETNDLKVSAEEWGSWSRWKECPRGEFICGINTRVESPGGDDTALNDIEHQCCKPILKKKKKAKST